MTRLLRVLQWAVTSPHDGWSASSPGAAPSSRRPHQLEPDHDRGFSNGTSTLVHGLAHPEITGGAAQRTQRRQQDRARCAAGGVPAQPAGSPDKPLLRLVHFLQPRRQVYSSPPRRRVGREGQGDVFYPKPNPDEATNFNGAHMLIIEPNHPPETAIPRCSATIQGCDFDPDDPYSCTIGTRRPGGTSSAAAEPIVSTGPPPVTPIPRGVRRRACVSASQRT